MEIVTINSKVDDYKRMFNSDIKNGIIKPNDNGVFKKSITIPPYRKRIVVRGKSAYELATKMAKKYFEYQEKVLSQEPISSTFSAVADEYYELEIEHSTCNLQVKKDYKSMIENHLKPGFGSLCFSELNYSDFQKFLNKYEDYGKALVSKVRMLLNNIIHFANKNGYYNGPVDLKLKLPATIPLKKKDYIADDYMSAMIHTCNSHYFGDIVMILYLCGLRPKELCNLKWEDVLIDENVIYIHNTKTESGTRYVPLCPTAKKIFEQRKQFCDDNHITCENVFTLHTKMNTPYNTDSISRAFGCFWRKTNIDFGAGVYRNQIIRPAFEKNITPYYLRHTFCTNLKISDVDYETIKRVMGHSLSYDITASVYTHLKKENIVKKMQPYFDFIEEKLTEFDVLVAKKLSLLDAELKQQKEL